MFPSGHVSRREKIITIRRDTKTLARAATGGMIGVMGAVLPSAIPVAMTTRNARARIVMIVRVLLALGASRFVKFPFPSLSFRNRNGWLRLCGRSTIHAALIH